MRLLVTGGAGFSRSFGGEVDHGAFALHAVTSPIRVDLDGIAISRPASP